MSENRVLVMGHNDPSNIVNLRGIRGFWMDLVENGAASNSLKLIAASCIWCCSATSGLGNGVATAAFFLDT